MLLDIVLELVIYKIMSELWNQFITHVQIEDPMAFNQHILEYR